MPPSKYERELRFIHNEIGRLTSAIQQLTPSMPSDPEEAKRKAETISAMQDEIAALDSRRREIEASFIASGLDIPDINRSMNATVHNAGAFEVIDQDEAEMLAGLSAPRSTAQTIPVGLEDVTAQIDSVSNELASVERSIVAAEIEGKEAEMDKLKMMASSLRERRETLIQTAKQIRAEKAFTEERPVPADDGLSKRIESLESENRSMKAQISDIRGNLLEVKEQLRQIIAALGIQENDE